MQKWTRVMYQPNIALGENGGKRASTMCAAEAEAGR